MKKPATTNARDGRVSSQFDFLMSLLVVMASLGMALVILWAASRLAGIDTFERLPDWIKGGLGTVFTAIVSGGSLLTVLIRSIRSGSGPNFLAAILIVAVGFCLLIVALSKLIEPHPSPSQNASPVTQQPPHAGTGLSEPAKASSHEVEDKVAVFSKRYIPIPGGYMTFDASQKMVVSSTPAGGPAENFHVDVDLPRAGYYGIDAMWTAAIQTEVWVYYKNLPTCANPNMDRAAIYFLPEIRDGWSSESLPSIPQRVGIILLPKGKATITFTSRSCGGGQGGGRLPSTEWVKLTEMP